MATNQFEKVEDGRTLVGVDGCRKGWVAVTRDSQGGLASSVFATFDGLVAGLPANATMVVDMPIGLPPLQLAGGRVAEVAARAAVPSRRNSVFAIPSRSAVYAETANFATQAQKIDAMRRANAVARSTSERSSGFSIQAFSIFHKIREIDALIRQKPELRSTIFESHPEIAFWRLNGEIAPQEPKKRRGRVNPPGMDERRAILIAAGVPAAFVSMPPPSGAGADDFLDAVAMMVIAARVTTGVAMPLPDPPGADEHGIPVAIWT